MNSLDSNTSYEDISDNQIIQEFDNPVKYTRMNMYSLMANRANQNTQIKDLLFGIILDEKKRNEVVMGIIKHAWLPVLFILEEGSDRLKNELKNILREWSFEEKKLFLSYIKQEKPYFNLLFDIVD